MAPPDKGSSSRKIKLFLSFMNLPHPTLPVHKRKILNRKSATHAFFRNIFQVCITQKRESKLKNHVIQCCRVNAQEIG
jgi:hypothetical protein